MRATECRSRPSAPGAVALLLATSAALLAACAANRAPSEKLLSPSEAEHTALGSWVIVWLRADSATTTALLATSSAAEKALARGAWLEVEGELLAATPAMLYVRVERLSVDDDTLEESTRPIRRSAGKIGKPGSRRIPAGDIARVRLEKYRTSKLGLGIWGSLGALSSFSHGFFAVASLPVWLLTDGVTSAVESRHAFQDIDAGVGLEALAPWARFPQGVVPGLDEGLVGGGP
jgi:hypothetical protein